MNTRPSRRTLLIGLALALSSLSAIAQSDVVYDIVIRNGRVLDGMGNPWIRADVAIKDGRFARIGAVTGRGRQEIDATGRYVSPGWIDMMDQSGARAAAQRPGGEQAAHGRDDGDRRRGRHAGAGRAHRRVLRRPREAGHQHQLRHLLQRDAGARRRARQHRARADRRRARRDAGDPRDRDAGRRDGHDDGAHLSAEQLRDAPTS